MAVVVADDMADGMVDGMASSIRSCIVAGIAVCQRWHGDR